MTTALSFIEMTPEAFDVAEGVIRAGLDTFVAVGQALLTIRDGRGYRHAGYTEFDTYCRERWHWSEASATRHIQAAQVAAALPIGNGPWNEAQARELVPLLRSDPESIPEIWQEARETAPNGQVTAAHVAEVVERHARPVPESESRPMRETPLLRYSQNLPTATIVSLILRVFFSDAKTALDVTYGSGQFWDGSAHVNVTAHDLNPERAPHGVLDFTRLPYADAAYDVVLADPPHLADAGEESVMGQRFGTGTGGQLEDAIRSGASEAWRTARLGLVIKVTDHVHSRRYQLESDWVREALGGLEPYDVVHQVRSGALVDPKWGDQMSAYNNGSTYLIFRKDGPFHKSRGTR